MVQKLFAPCQFTFVGLFGIGKTQLLIRFHVRYLESRTVVDLYRLPLINQRFLKLVKIYQNIFVMIEKTLSDKQLSMPTSVTINIRNGVKLYQSYSVSAINQVGYVPRTIVVFGSLEVP